MPDLFLKINVKKRSLENTGYIELCNETLMLGA
jgi:hypothetical protein